MVQMITKHAVINSTLGEWQFCRQLTYSLLESLSDDDLSFSPGDGMGQFWMQFRHLGRIQTNFLQGIRTLEMHFDAHGGGYSGRSTSHELADYLHNLDAELILLLRVVDIATSIRWEAPGDTPQVWEHLSRMISHEYLHHGQWVVYMRLLGRPFPQSWNWAWGLE